MHLNLKLCKIMPNTVTIKHGPGNSIISNELCNNDTTKANNNGNTPQSFQNTIMQNKCEKMILIKTIELHNIDDIKITNSNIEKIRDHETTDTLRICDNKISDGGLVSMPTSDLNITNNIDNKNHNTHEPFDNIDGLFGCKKITNCNCSNFEIDSVTSKFIKHHCARLKKITTALAKNSLRPGTSLFHNKNTSKNNSAGNEIQKRPHTGCAKEVVGTWSTGEWPKYNKQLLNDCDNKSLKTKKVTPITKFIIGSVGSNPQYAFEIDRIKIEWRADTYVIDDSFLYAFISGSTANELQSINTLLMIEYNMYISREEPTTFFIVDLDHTSIYDNHLWMHFCIKELIESFIEDVKSQLKNKLNIIIMIDRPMIGRLGLYRSAIVRGKYRNGDRTIYEMPLISDDSIFQIIKNMLKDHKLIINNDGPAGTFNIKKITALTNYISFFS